MLVGRGGASPGLVAVLGLIKLAPRGGSGLVRSGPEVDCFRCLGGEPLTDLSLPMGLADSFDGLRILASGTDGRLNVSSWGCVRRGNVCDLCSGCRVSRSASSSLIAGGGPKPPYPFFLGCFGSPKPGLKSLELFVEDRECPESAVAGRCILPPKSAVPVGIAISFMLPTVACLWWPLSSGGLPNFLRPLISKGPGAIVFILCKSPPVVAFIGLTGAYIGSASAYLSPMPPYPPAS